MIKTYKLLWTLWSKKENKQEELKQSSKFGLEHQTEAALKTLKLIKSQYDSWSGLDWIQAGGLESVTVYDKDVLIFSNDEALKNDIMA